MLWFIIYSLYYVEKDSFYAHFLKSFSYKWVLNFVESFSCIIEIIIWFLSFNLLLWCITLINLCILKNTCILEINPTWSSRMILLICHWILNPICLLKFCWGLLHLCSPVILACNFLFVWYLCLVLVSGAGGLVE